MTMSDDDTLNMAGSNEAFSVRDRMLVMLLPWMRGRLSVHPPGQTRLVATVCAEAGTTAFVNAPEAERHIQPGAFALTLPGDLALRSIHVKLPGAPPAEAGRHVEDIKAKFNETLGDTPGVRAQPCAVFLPGIGVICWGRNKREADVIAAHCRRVIGGCRGGETASAPAADASRGDFGDRVIVVAGGGSGIGREVAARLHHEGAHVAIVDLLHEAAAQTAAQLQGAIAIACDITNRRDVRAMFHRVVLAFGGFDAAAVTAGIFPAPGADGHVDDRMWAAAFNVNVTGSYIVADEARAVWLEQGLKAGLVLTTSANAIVAKKGSLAYDTSKAAANHLVRELAIELAPLVRVNAVAPATVIEGSAMFPRDRVISSLTKYNVSFSGGEPTESLREKLALFYAKRTLLHEPITPADQAEAYLILLSEKLSKTTGHIIPVDGGLEQAFLR